jgi:hypothetical protein
VLTTAADHEPGPLPTRQSVLVAPALAALERELVTALDPSSRLLVADNCASLGSRWLTTVPYFPSLRLSDAEVSAALHIRTLCPGSSPHCLHCARPNAPGHDELCDGRPNWRLARHERVKKTLVHHLRAVPDTVVLPEPLVPGTQLRTDFRVTGAASPIGVASELDLTIVAPASAQALATVARLTAHAPPTTLQEATATLAAHLADVAERKVRKYSGRTATPFVPLVLSAGGTVAGGASSRAFAHWRKCSPQPFPFLASSISLQLVRCRARFFAF